MPQKSLVNGIRRKVSEVFGAEADSVDLVPNVPNNSVFRVSVDRKLYIFKIYRQKDWPEDGKVVFVNSKLVENGIPCAKVIVFDRTDPYFEGGFLIEEFLPGRTAGNLVFDKEAGDNFYRKLARLVTQVHGVRIRNYGYIGHGNACYESFSSFFSDAYYEVSRSLVEKGLFEARCLSELKKHIVSMLCSLDCLPSVLCHGDISAKNVMIDDRGELILIDWDDAISSNWVSDIARMTYWMRFAYDQTKWQLFRRTFLANYQTDTSKDYFDEFEQVFHIWFGLDHLNFYANTHQEYQYERSLKYLNEIVETVV